MNTTIRSGGTFSAGSDSWFYYDIKVANSPCPSLTRPNFAAGAEISCPTGLPFPPFDPLDLGYDPSPSAPSFHIPNYSSGTLLSGNYSTITIGDGATVHIGDADIVARSITIGSGAKFVSSKVGNAFPILISIGKFKIGDRVSFQNIDVFWAISNYTSASGNSDPAIDVGSDLNQAIGGGFAPIWLQTTDGLVYLHSRAKITGFIVSERLYTSDDVQFSCYFDPNEEVTKRNIRSQSSFSRSELLH